MKSPTSVAKSSQTRAGKGRPNTGSPRPTTNASSMNRNSDPARQVFSVSPRSTLFRSDVSQSFDRRDNIEDHPCCTLRVGKAEVQGVERAIDVGITAVTRDDAKCLQLIQTFR